MGPVDENTRTFYLDCYFRQKWMDKRLAFNKTDGVDDLALNWQFLAKIWVPDTFFVNGKKSYLHKITVSMQKMLSVLRKLEYFTGFIVFG